MRPTPGPLLTLLLALVAALALAAGASPAGAKKARGKNPLSGSYAGTTEAGGTVSFRITKGGSVVNFVAGAITVGCPQPWTDMSQPPPPSLILTRSGTINAAGPIHLRQPEPGFPKGHRFDYVGPGGDPAGEVAITGKLAVGFRGMEGFFDLRRVPSGSLICHIQTNATVRLTSWDARKIGGK